jgi:hypothetical protein
VTVSKWVDAERDPSAISVDEQVEMRCKTKRLADCELPEGFHLITRTPRQYWLEQQLRWSFELAFGEHRHVARYLQQVSDEMQMQWAIHDFTAELMFKGVSLEKARKHHQTTNSEGDSAMKPMKPLALLLALFMVALTPLHAAEGILAGQATAHTDVLTWTASPTPNTTVNVYRAAGSCASNPTSFTQIATGVAAGGPYTDASPLVGTQCYYVTATLNAVESAPSNKVSVTSLVSLQPPTGLAGTSN